MPQGLLSLGINRGTTRWHRTRSGPAWRHAPRSEAWDTKAAGARFARCVAGSSPGSRARIGLAKPGADGPPSDERTPEPKEADVWRDEVRCAGNEARPFLGRSASRQGPHDPPSCAPRPAEPAVLEPDRLASLETEASNPDAKDQRSRGDCDIPETRPLRTSCSGCTGFRGDRVHRGEPLLLGVNKEYQVSYRLFARGP